jgi:MFS family permease
LTRRLSSLPAPAFALFAAMAAFACYFSMYAFRRPFTAASFEGLSFLDSGVTLKTSLVLSQIIGYTLSKYIGVKICSETTAAKRTQMLIALILAAQFSLLLFGLLPGSWKVAAMFLNGLPLGMVWGLVVAYLEGRRCSDFVMAALCGSFIVASASVKDVGRWLMTGWHIPETWMPAATGLLFLPVFGFAVFLLSSLPAPDARDLAARKPRQTMDKKSRHAFLRRYAPGLTLLFVFYFFLTAFRDFRDNFGVEIFLHLGFGSEDTGLFTRTEIPVAVASLSALAMLNLIRDNRRALLFSYGFMILGMLILAASTLAHQSGHLGAIPWMIATGLGAYLAYTPINAVLFERLMAATGSAGTAVFGIQLADSIGYTGSAAIQLFKDLGNPSGTHLAFFSHFSLALGIGGIVLAAAGAWYFQAVTRPKG